MTTAAPPPYAHPLTGLVAALHDRSASVAVVGLGYVGQPLARALARRYATIGIDISPRRLAELAPGGTQHHSWEGTTVTLSADAAVVATCRVVIIAVPTPVDAANTPDLSPLLSACTAVGRHLRPGTMVIFESTVYPGCTEEDCVPVLERSSGLKAGCDFCYAYSPERINPGDTEHTIERVIKVVAGMDAETTECIASVYGAALPAGVYRAATVKVAEAAKVIENTQRDLNIALMNELAQIFQRLNIDTADVLAAAGTKWNFLPFKPGLVGGHCIGVDPYYLTHKAQTVGHHPQVILAGRRINDGMGRMVARECLRRLARSGAVLKGARVLILGGTFKEDVADLRNSRVRDIVSELADSGIDTWVCDPLAEANELRHEIGGTPVAWDDVNSGATNPLAASAAAPWAAIIIAVVHRPFRNLDAAALKKLVGSGLVLDVKGMVDRHAAAAVGLDLWRL